HISYTKGAAKISRDDTKRRIVVGINVRNRDLQSVVTDVQRRIESNIDLPVGYNITYGGQFENLQSAKDRLKIAVPIALVLIFFLLFFAFESVKDALMIYSAIPLAAVGGVFFLWIRDMPFSISAGVGFIALFGIAVLNGIVLIEHFKELKHQGMIDIEARIKQGTKDRLRAVLLTASAAALGFLPMAISTSAGAEVQRPLATVVIGGLITATLLTLVVLPVLYAIFDSKIELKKIINKKQVQGLTILLLLFTINTNAQDKGLHFDDIRALALENNAGIKAAALKVEETEALVGSSFNFDKTEVYYHYDQNNLAFNGKAIEVYGIQQSIMFPTLYFAGKRINKAKLKIEQSRFELQKQALERDVASAYYQFLYTREKQEVYKYLDSIYQKFAKASQRRFELGETNYLEKITAQAKQKELLALFNQAREDVGIAYAKLQKITQVEEPLIIAISPLPKLQLSQIDVTLNAGILLYDHRNLLFEAKSGFERQSLLPDISFDYFQGTNSGLGENLYGYQVGLKIPLIFSGNASKIKAAKIAKNIAIEESFDYKNRLQLKYEQLIGQLRKYEEALKYYENSGKNLSDEILKTASISFQNGEIDFFQYIQSLENAYSINISYLENLNMYNQTVIALNHLTL
ncbi:MAG: efflux RND transporter permease subunit, partial [Maribacter sp.]|nr:efflux RND transporter permease subunit [Maribacter sp.]MBT8313624.1 efflux RND transporter permease subunit [Maribacter sp.]